MHPKRTITQQQIDKNMSRYLKKVEADIKKMRIERKAPTTAFLLQIKSQIQLSIDHGVSYKNIAKSIEEIFSFRTTENSIRNFANTYLKVNKQIARHMMGSGVKEKKEKNIDHLPKSSKTEKIDKLHKKTDQASSDGDEF